MKSIEAEFRPLPFMEWRNETHEDIRFVSRRCDYVCDVNRVEMKGGSWGWGGKREAGSRGTPAARGWSMSGPRPAVPRRRLRTSGRSPLGRRPLDQTPTYS